jgi:hypothetical protein
MEQILLTSITLEELLDKITERINKALSITLERKETPIPEDLLTIEDLESLFKVSKVTIHKWKKRGLIPFYKMNRKVYFKRSEVINSMSHKKRKLEVNL